MGPLIAAAGVCVLIGGGIGWLVARYLSRALLRALWLGLAICFVWILWPAIRLWLGLVEGNGFEGVAEVFLAFIFVLPTLLASVLGGWLGLRRRALAEDRAGQAGTGGSG